MPTSSFSMALCMPTSPSPSPSPHHHRSGKPLLCSQKMKPKSIPPPGHGAGGMQALQSGTHPKPHGNAPRSRQPPYPMGQSWDTSIPAAPTPLLPPYPILFSPPDATLQVTRVLPSTKGEDDHMVGLRMASAGWRFGGGLSPGFATSEATCVGGLTNVPIFQQHSL